MRVLAQCEKGVTISEPLGHPEEGGWASAGSKTPLGIRTLSYDGQIQAELSRYLRCGRPTYCTVFNKIAAQLVRVAKRRASVGGELRWEGSPGTGSGWFGPNFVTILTAGVRVCTL
jgi:hypothetical protein